MTQTIKRVCVLGTHHAYQYQTVRGKYFENVSALIEIHSVDLVAEEASGIAWDTYAKKIADIRKVSWEVAVSSRRFFELNLPRLHLRRVVLFCDL
jgi:hypothetical protein